MLAGLSAVLLAACTGTSGSDSETTAGSSLVLAQTVAPSTLDPQAASTNAEHTAWEFGYQCLLTMGEDGSPEPALATDYKKEGLSYVFNLREDVKFHNDAPFTAEDVVYTFDRLQKTGIPYAKQRFPNLSSVTTVNPHQVRFTLSAANPGFLFNMADPSMVACAILSKKAGESGNNFASRMVGTGPLKQVSYAPDSQLTLERFDGYWGSPATISKLQVLFMPNTASQRAALLSGKIDVMRADSSDVTALKSNSAVKIQSSQSHTIDLLQVNSAKPPFDKLDVRKALAYAIDRPALAASAFLGQATPTGMLPATFPGAPEPAYGGAQVQKAKELLAKAGYPDGLKTTLTYIAGYSPGATRLVQVLKSQLAEAGIDVTLDPQESAGWVEKEHSGQFELLWNEYPYFSDPYGHLKPYPNRQGPAPAPVQKALDEALSAEPGEYLAAIARLAAAGTEYVYPTLPLVALKFSVAYRAGVDGMSKLSPSGSWGFLSYVTKG